MNWPAWLTPEKAMGIFGAILLAVITGTYTVAYQVQQNRVDDRDRAVEAQEKEIESLQTAKTWDVPNTIDRLSEISKTLQKQFSSMDELNTLRKENETLRAEREVSAKQYEEIASKLKETAAQNTLIRSKMDSVFASSQKIDLERGKAFELVKNNLTLGVSAVYADSSISGRLGNEYVSMTVGDSKDVRVLGKNCRVTLVEARIPMASFVFFCS